ncbi:MAG TPA: twin-arginine translocase TatA/TatE family subunit [Stellaceae bacterium]|nr:twin-arginine translocase TatA/TatE family subunit [Stellaceae bacterium]
MGSFSIWHWLIVIAVVAVLFGGRGKLTNVMGDFAKGIKAFKSGLKEEDAAEQAPPPRVTPPTGQASTATDHPAHDRT